MSNLNSGLTRQQMLDALNGGLNAVTSADLETALLTKADASDLTAETTARQTSDTKHDNFIKYLLDGNPKNLSYFMHDALTIYKITFTPNLETGTLTIQTDGASTGYRSYRILGKSADNTGWEYGIPIQRGTYKLLGLPAGAGSSTFRYILGIIPSSSATRTSASVYEDYEFEITTDTARIDLSAYVSQGANISTAVTLYPMIVRKDIYTLSPDFAVGYPKLSEMWAAIKASQT